MSHEITSEEKKKKKGKKRQRQPKRTSTYICVLERLVLFLEENRLITETRGDTEIANLNFSPGKAEIAS